jgi:glycosyltransferase involved in cell wall biosynthesis
VGGDPRPPLLAVREPETRIRAHAGEQPLVHDHRRSPSGGQTPGGGRADRQLTPLLSAHRRRGGRCDPRIPLVLEIRDLWPDYLVDMGVLRMGSRAARGLYATERHLIRRPALRGGHRIVQEESDREGSLRAQRQRGIERGGHGALPTRSRTGALPGMDSDAGGPVVGYLGNMGAGQDLQAIVRAAAIVARTMPEVRFVLAGDGADRLRIEGLSMSLA